MTMTDLDTKTVGKLQELLSVNIDSEKGFQEAARTTKDVTLQQFFTEFSQRRAENASELRQYIRAAGKQPSESGSVAGTLHRWWIDAKQAMVRDDVQSILNEAERGEDTIKHSYERALLEVPESTARSVIERQYRNVKDAHDRVKLMRDSYKARKNPA